MQALREQTAEQLEQGHDAALAQHRRQVDQARYNAARAERRYRAVDPDNRLVARGLETEWNTALQQLADAEAELARRQTGDESVVGDRPHTGARSGFRPQPVSRR